jgi:Patatin-like phospholipase
MPPGSNYRILSLDGGGCWAMIQARALQAIYGDLPGHEILADFDLCAGNSGGSIILGCLIENMRPSEMVAFFMDEGRRRSVFVELLWYQRLMRVIGLGPKYKAAAKINGLRAALPRTGSMLLPELSDHVRGAGGHAPDFLITSFDYDRLRAIYYRSRTDSASSSGPKPYVPTLAETLSASCNAPVNYFDEPVTVGQARCWDGGIGGNNNPALAAVTEAKANGVPGAIKVLSLGTGTVRLPIEGDRGAHPPIAQAIEDSGTTHDIKLLATSILDDPPDAASFLSHIMLGQPLPQPGGAAVAGAITRLSPLVQPILSTDGSRWELPPGYNDEDFEWIANLDMDAIKQEQVGWISRLADAWIEGRFLNQPIRAGKSFECQIGHRRFSEGRDAWRAEVGR